MSITIELEHKTVAIRGRWCHITLDVVSDFLRHAPEMEEAEYDDMMYGVHQSLKTLENSKLYEVRVTGVDLTGRLISWIMPAYDQSLLRLFKQDTAKWYGVIQEQLPLMLHKLTSAGFMHNDLALRNIMVDDEEKLHFIDYDSIVPFNLDDEEDAELHLVYVEHDLRSAGVSDADVETLMSRLGEILNKQRLLTQ